MYTVAQVAKILKKDASWIKRLIYSGRIKAVKHGVRTWIITDYSGAIGLQAGNPDWIKKKRP